MSGRTTRHIRWESIDGVVGTTVSSLAGDAMMLVFSLGEGGTLTVPEDAVVLPMLSRDLHLHLRGARRYADFSLELVGSGGSPVEIYRRD